MDLEWHGCIPSETRADGQGTERREPALDGLRAPDGLLLERQRVVELLGRDQHRMHDEIGRVGLDGRRCLCVTEHMADIGTLFVWSHCCGGGGESAREAQIFIERERLRYSPSLDISLAR